MARICPVCQQRAVSVAKLAIHGHMRCAACQSEVSPQPPWYAKAPFAVAYLGLLFGLKHLEPSKIIDCAVVILYTGIIIGALLYVAPLKPYVAPPVKETYGTPASAAFWWTFFALVGLCVIALATLKG